MADLIFGGLYTPPPGGSVDLDFAPTSGKPVVLGEIGAISPPATAQFTVVRIITAELAATAPPPAAQITGAKLIEASLCSVAQAPKAVVEAVYNINVWRGIQSRAKGDWQPARAASPSTASPYQDSRPLRAVRDQPWQTGVALKPGTVSGWQTPPSLRSKRSTRWQVASKRAPDTRGRFASLTPTPKRLIASWRVARALPLSVLDLWQWMLPCRIRLIERAQVAQPLPAARDARYQVAAFKGGMGDGVWQDGRTVTSGGKWVPIKPVNPDQPYVGDPNLHFCRELPVSTDLDFAWKCAPPVDPETDTVVIPTLRTYIMTATVVLERVRGNLELPLLAASVSLDAGTATWGVDISAPESVLADLSEREPLRITINGHVVLWLAERWSLQRAFGGARTIKLTGRSVHAEIDAPQWPASSGTVTAPTNARQLAEQALEATGYTLDWSLPDWLVPAGAWSWEAMTPLARVARLAEAAGGRVFGDPSARKLLARADYPSAPWDWSRATPRLQLPDAVLETLSEDWDETPEINAIIVSGERAGVTARVRRFGSAGDKLAATVVDALLTDAAPARARGLNAIAASGKVCRVQLSLPVFADKALSLPGDLVSVTGSSPFRALVRGVRLSVERKGALVVRQQLDLERRA